MKNGTCKSSQSSSRYAQRNFLNTAAQRRPAPERSLDSITEAVQRRRTTRRNAGRSWPQGKLPTRRRNRVTNVSMCPPFWRCRDLFRDGRQSSAFSVVTSSCLRKSTHTHEMGHNFGCLHDRDSSHLVSTYSHGKRYCRSPYVQ